MNTKTPFWCPCTKTLAAVAQQAFAFLKAGGGQGIPCRSHFGIGRSRALDAVPHCGAMGMKNMLPWSMFSMMCLALPILNKQVQKRYMDLHDSYILVVYTNCRKTMQLQTLT